MIVCSSGAMSSNLPTCVTVGRKSLINCMCLFSFKYWDLCFLSDQWVVTFSVWNCVVWNYIIYISLWQLIVNTFTCTQFTSHRYFPLCRKVLPPLCTFKYRWEWWELGSEDRIGSLWPLNAQFDLAFYFPTFNSLTLPCYNWGPLKTYHSEAGNF